ncbi:helix-turn-helix transcriptional regulator [Acetobacter indonesiensis]|uniref:AraC family transcriptional regulator n=1 Tax=Acetobacter indonesiensis TaxID=104101 RepID=A0A252AUU7_9PROT|nr:AraC family transcriptional regulator [Acetobacter indonesiensis]OUI94018.1 AraC family transcriptional regulator [Acetobacter indonesiensis]
MSALSRFTIRNYLHGRSVPAVAEVELGAGLAMVIWDRDERTCTTYETPNHHTLSLYLEHGDKLRKRTASGWQNSHGAGDFCLMPHNVSTEWDVQGPIRMFHFYIAPQTFDRAAHEIFDMDPGRVRLGHDAYFRNPRLERQIRTCMINLCWQPPENRLALGQQAQTLLHHVLKQCSTRLVNAPQRGGLSPANLRRVDDYVRQALDQPLGVEDLAAVVGVSPYHFIRSFRQSSGETPHAFVLRRRLEHAAFLLKMGEPASTVAHACGFSSHSHLSARFRQFMGVTPTEYALWAGPRQIAQ